MTENNMKNDTVETFMDAITARYEGGEPEQFVRVRMSLNSKALNHVPELTEIKYGKDGE